MASDDVLLMFCLMKFDELTQLVVGLDDELANTAPDVPEANSPVAILVHCCGMMRRWSGSVNPGLALPRDREAEFTARLAVTDAAMLARETRSTFADDIQNTEMDLAPVAVPPSWEAFWTATCRGVLFHVFEELCQHLGQAEITRDLLTASNTHWHGTATDAY
ncbi:DUF664 domain-containing protein [Arthrobacter sp. Br18]|uniref:mycothiol transferase n=1 Tax=Arthrobacter sp. Br18 TaxID=1312954 RepID=UPI000686F5DD|nr:DUF664 domain-containing protein [Arthrobacter sp. Br18]